MIAWQIEEGGFGVSPVEGLELGSLQPRRARPSILVLTTPLSKGLSNILKQGLGTI